MAIALPGGPGLGSPIRARLPPMETRREPLLSSSIWLYWRHDSDLFLHFGVYSDTMTLDSHSCGRVSGRQHRHLSLGDIWVAGI